MPRLFNFTPILLHHPPTPCVCRKLKRERSDGEVRLPLALSSRDQHPVPPEAQACPCAQTGGTRHIVVSLIRVEQIAKVPCGLLDAEGIVTLLGLSAGICGRKRPS
jgi:hypothetical protein